MADSNMSEGLNCVSFNSGFFNSVSFNSFSSLPFNSVSWNSSSFSLDNCMPLASFGALDNFMPSPAPREWDFVAVKTGAVNINATRLYGDDGTFSVAADWTSSDPSDPSDDEMLDDVQDAHENSSGVVAGISGHWELPDVFSMQTGTWMQSVQVSMEPVVGSMPCVIKPAQAPRVDILGAGPAVQVPCPRACAWEIKPRLRRRKIGEGSKHSLGGRPVHVLEEGHLTPVALTPELLRTCFGLPLHEAARTLGICATAVKKCCRKMGIKQWPYQRLKPIQSRLAKLQSLASTTESAREIKDLEAQRQALLEGHNLECLNGSQ
jgi:hypothetical protein